MLLRTPEPAPNYYWNIATSLLESGAYGFDGGATTAIEPLYPLFLALTRIVTGDRYTLVMLVQVLLASAGGVLITLAAHRLTRSRIAALAAAALYAVYPYYVRQSVAPHELTLSAVLLAGSVWQYYRTENTRHAALLGGWLGLLLLLRFTFVPVWVGAVTLFLLRRRPGHALAVFIVPLLIVAPWLIRTRVIDRSVVPTRVGENLFIASCEHAEEVLPWHDADLMVIHAYRAVDADGLSARVAPKLVERTIDDALMRRAVECIRVDPARALRLKLRNFFYVFAPVLLPIHARLDEASAVVEDGRLRLVNIHPRPRFEMVTHAMAHTVILAGALTGMWVRRRHLLRDDAFLLVIVASMAGVYAVFFPTTRLTAPMTVVLILYAAAAAGWLFSLREEQTE